MGYQQCGPHASRINGASMSGEFWNLKMLNSDCSRAKICLLFWCIILFGTLNWLYDSSVNQIISYRLYQYILWASTDKIGTKQCVIPQCYFFFHLVLISPPPPLPDICHSEVSVVVNGPLVFSPLLKTDDSSSEFNSSQPLSSLCISVAPLWSLKYIRTKNTVWLVFIFSEPQPS